MTDSNNQEDFRKISETQQRLDILIEHVESRKEALEEEIQEHLHESLANARDSMAVSYTHLTLPTTPYV